MPIGQIQRMPDVHGIALWLDQKQLTSNKYHEIYLHI